MVNKVSFVNCVYEGLFYEVNCGKLPVCSVACNVAFSSENPALLCNKISNFFICVLFCDYVCIIIYDMPQLMVSG